MKQTRFISVVIATLLLICSADAFAQRSRGGGSGSRGGSRSSSSASHSSSSLGSISQSGTQCCRSSYETYKYNNAPISSIANRPAYKRVYFNKSSVTHCSKRDVLSSSCPNYGYQVSKRTATKYSIQIPHSTETLYYRDGIFFSKCPESRKYAIYKPSSGVHVPVLPDSSSMYELDGKAYYYYYATYYTFDESTFDFVVVTPPVGLEVDKIPCDAKEVVVDDEYYHIVDNVLYKEIDSKYEVAKLDKEVLQKIKAFLASTDYKMQIALSDR